MATDDDKQVEMRRRNSRIDQPNNEPGFLKDEKNHEGPKIGKVPEILVQNKDHEDSFRPLLMALGPYHQGKHGEELKMQLMQEGEQRLNYAPGEKLIKIQLVQEEGQHQLNYKRGEELKIQLVRKFYKGEAVLTTSYWLDYEKVLAVSSEAKKWYSEESTKHMNEAEFAKMMFHDGCAILQFISCVANGDWIGVYIKNHEIPLIKRDLFLLENQLPSFVLKELIKAGTENNIKNMFQEFIETTGQAPEDSKSLLAKFSRFLNERRARKKKGRQPSSKKEEKEEEPLHLLQSLWKYYVKESEYDNDNDDVQTPSSKKEVQSSMGDDKKKKKSSMGDWYTFRSAKELKAAGISFSRIKTTKFSDVQYLPVLHPKLPWSYLCLPPIVVDDTTKSMLLNLASYEMSSSDSAVTNVVCSYICFMDSLIDHKEDVVELRRRRIILNRLGSDEKVARLFNDVAKHLVPDPKVFRHVKMEIDRHYRSWFKTWINEAVHTHFRRPWTVVVFLVAVAGLVMTFIQTYASLVGLIKKLN